MNQRASGQTDQGAEPWRTKLLVPTAAGSTEKAGEVFSPGSTCCPQTSPVTQWSSYGSDFLELRHLQWGPGLRAAPDIMLPQVTVILPMYRHSPAPKLPDTGICCIKSVPSY